MDVINIYSLTQPFEEGQYVERVQSNTHIEPINQLSAPSTNANSAQNGLEFRSNPGYSILNQTSVLDNHITAQALLGKDIPTNTRRANKVSLKSLCLFVYESENKSSAHGSSINVFHDWEQAGRRIISPYDTGFLLDNYAKWTEMQLK